jgi:uncharacterized protein
VHEELIREIYVRVNADRSDEVPELLQEDAVLELPPGNLDAGVHRGHDAISQAAQGWADSWDDFSMEPEEVVERGDEVFVMCRYRGRGRGSGVPLDSLVAHLWEIRDGKVARWRIFGDAVKARRRRGQIDE